MNCVCCGKQRQSIEPVKSRLLPSVTLLMCNECREAKYEPRHIVVITARSKGIETVREFINKRLYCGQDITAEEIIL